jgi:hypothetical protein
MFADTWERNAKRHSYALVDEQVVASRGGNRTNSEAGTAQPVSNAPLGELVLLNSIHVPFDVTRRSDIRVDFLTLAIHSARVRGGVRV